MMRWSPALLTGALLACGCGDTVSVNQQPPPPPGPCEEGTPAAGDISGRWFALVEMETPVKTQLQLFLELSHDTASGQTQLSFVNADRDPALLCAPACDVGMDEVCSPTHGCVPASYPAESTAEHGEFIENGEPPTGYTAATSGCVYDAPLRLDVEPFDIVLVSPPVTVQNMVFSWTLMDDTELHGSGSISAQQVLLGTTPSGPASGSIDALRTEQ